jgi:predicted dehydrogenase
VPGLGGWFTQKQFSGGGALIDLGMHRLDLALWFMGHPIVASVSGTSYNHLGTEIAARAGTTFDVDDLAVGLIRFTNGATLTLEASWATNSEKREEMWTQLFGTRGDARLRHGFDEGALDVLVEPGPVLVALFQIADQRAAARPRSGDRPGPLRPLHPRGAPKPRPRRAGPDRDAGAGCDL